MEHNLSVAATVLLGYWLPRLLLKKASPRCRIWIPELVSQAVFLILWFILGTLYDWHLFWVWATVLGLHSSWICFAVDAGISFRNSTPPVKKERWIAVVVYLLLPVGITLFKEIHPFILLFTVLFL